MKNKIAALLSAVLCVMAIASFSVSAASVTSSVTISASQTHARGNEVLFNGAVTCSGSNSSSSKNDLWVELFKETFGTDKRITGSCMAPGSSATAWKTTVDNGKYYIWLDPDGTLYTNCIGSGKAVGPQGS